MSVWTDPLTILRSDEVKLSEYQVKRMMNLHFTRYMSLAGSTIHMVLQLRGGSV